MNAPAPRRSLNPAEWLDALGLDPFWIVEDAPQQTAINPQTGVVPANPAPTRAPVETVHAATLPPATDWASLEANIRNCQACGLCQARKQAVPGMGDRNPDWLIVGEAPGADEDVAGLPFVGKAGKLLDAMLAALGLDRDKGVYIANAVKCRPPGNRTPEIGEMDACNHFLAQQIDWLQPKVILVLGRPAAYAVLGREASIQSLRGTVHYREQGDRKIPVVVSYHPAYLLRQPEEKWKSWQDLLLAKASLG